MIVPVQIIQIKILECKLIHQRIELDYIDVFIGKSTDVVFRDREPGAAQQQRISDLRIPERRRYEIPRILEIQLIVSAVLHIRCRFPYLINE